MASTAASSTYNIIPSDTSDLSDIDSTVTPSKSQGRTLSEPQSSTRPRKRLKRTIDVVWEHARKPILGVEAVRSSSSSNSRRIWYCKASECGNYSVLSTSAARHHMRTVHHVEVDSTPSITITSRQKDLRQVFSKQALQQKESEEKEAVKSLQKAVDKTAIHQALLRLIINHDLPLSMVQWPELHTLVFALNHTAGASIWTSHTTTASHIAKTFIERQRQITAILRQSQSLIHLTTDTWHSTNHKELQAITAHFVDATGKQQKALLALPELHEGHAGEAVAPHILRTLERYSITEKLGYITTDNHGANDTMCRAIESALQALNWTAKERRLRCAGHIFNIAIQAFFYAKNDEALNVAINKSERSNTSIDDALLQGSQKEEEGGWLKVAPLQKVLNIATILRRSDRHYQQFKAIAGKVIRAHNDTRWNSYLNTFEDALELKAQFTSFCVTAERSDDLLSPSEWTLLEQTITFLQPFKYATKLLEGDSVSLDRVQLTMDSLVAHFQQQMSLHRNNTSFNASLVTAWHAFDKYYTLIDETGAYTAAILLHPNRRKSYLQAAWRKDWVNPGVERARLIWRQYKQNDDNNTIEDLSHLSQFERFQHEIEIKQRRSKGGFFDEFERFINAPAESIKQSALEYWLQPSQRQSYPQLSQMAIDILSTMAMSAESERVFSASRRTIAWTRASLSGAMIEMLECLKHWQRAGLISPEFIFSSSDSDGDDMNNNMEDI